MMVTFLANYSEEIVDCLPKEIDTGIYCGWARVADTEVHPMVLSIGWNPFYKNTKKSMVSRKYTSSS